MRSRGDPFERNMGIERKEFLAVMAPSEKLKTTGGEKNKYFVRCVSSVPLVTNTSKEELRMAYLNGVI